MPVSVDLFLAPQRPAWRDPSPQLIPRLQGLCILVQSSRPSTLLHHPSQPFPPAHLHPIESPCRPVELPSATHTHHSWIRPRQGRSNPPPKWNIYKNKISTPMKYLKHLNSRYQIPAQKHKAICLLQQPETVLCQGPEESRLVEAYDENLCFYVIRHGLIL